jgi:hypothetical protein
MDTKDIIVEVGLAFRITMAKEEDENKIAEQFIFNEVRSKLHDNIKLTQWNVVNQNVVNQNVETLKQPSFFQKWFTNFLQNRIGKHK